MGVNIAGIRTKILDDFYTENNTNNKLFGLEFFYQHAPTKNIKYSLGYTYLNNKMKVASKTYNNSNSYPYIIKASFSYVNKICNISMSYLEHSGDYYTEVVDTKYDDYTKVYEPLYANYNSIRYNNYRSLSLSLTKSFKIKKNELMSYLTIGNVLNKNNQMKVYYNEDYSQKKFYNYSPFIIYLGFSYKFGI